VARLNADAAQASRANTEVSVESSVVQAYYQYLGSEAVLFVAQKSLGVAEGNVKIVGDRRELGTASELDVQRALADVGRAQQDVASADQSVFVARRALESLSGLSPERAIRENYADDDLHEEAPLATWLRATNDDLVAVQAAVIGTNAAVASRLAARAVWIPTLAAQGQEHVTNAGGFTGHERVYTLTATATWRLDFAVAANIAAQTAALSAARATEDKTRRAAEDAIYQAWYQVRSGIEKARAARAQVRAATLAQDLARDRYVNGIATQIEVVQAQRDFFSAAVSQVQADFDLRYARARLRLTSRRSEGEDVQR
jgi:outer membrane protein TolC